MVFVLLSSSLSSLLLRFPDFLGLYSHTGSFKALKNKVRETVRLDNLKGGVCVPELFIRFLKIDDLVDQSNKERTKIIPSMARPDTSTYGSIRHQKRLDTSYIWLPTLFYASLRTLLYCKSWSLGNRKSDYNYKYQLHKSQNV